MRGFTFQQLAVILLVVMGLTLTVLLASTQLQQAGSSLTQLGKSATQGSGAAANATIGQACRTIGGECVNESEASEKGVDFNSLDPMDCGDKRCLIS